MRRALKVWWMALFLGGSPLVCAQAPVSVALDDLGDLALDFAAVTPVDEVPGPAVQGLLTWRDGDLYRLELPRDARRARYHVANGDAVTAGEPFVTLYGPEIHHLQLEFAALTTRFEAARERYRRSRESYRQQAIPEEQWVLIQDRFLELELEYEHMEHFQTLVRDAEGESDLAEEAVTLVAPLPGLIHYRQADARLVAGTEIAGFVPRDAIRLRARVPRADAQRLSGFDLGACRVGLEAVEGMSEGFLQTAWSDALPASCGFPPGTALSVTPLYQQRAAYRVPRSAVFTWQETAHILMRDGGVLEAVPVTLLMPVDGDSYAITAQRDLADREVLSRSVSAVQGFLLNLGGE
jgi:hypothetical protein